MNMNSINWYDSILMSTFHKNQEIRIKWIQSKPHELLKIKDVWWYTVPLECVILNTKKEVLLFLSEIDFKYINPELMQ